MLNPLTMWITTNCGIFLKRKEYQSTLPAFWGRYAGQEATVRTVHGKKLRKEYVKAIYCHPAYLTYMQQISWDVLRWMKHKLESISVQSSHSGMSDSKIAGRDIKNLRFTDDTTLMAESEEELKSLLMKVKEESGKSWHKVQHSENEDHGIWSHHFMGNRLGNSGRLNYFGLQNHWRWWLQPWK